MTVVPQRGRAWYPHRSKGHRVEPTVPELLAMADGKRADWRPTEPTRTDLREIAGQEMCEHDKALTREHLAHAAELERVKATCLSGTPTHQRLEEEITDHWDAIGHLATGT